MVEEIIVAPEHRKGGTAQALLRELLRVSIEKYKIKRVCGTTYEDEHGMPYKIYRYLGFKKTPNLFPVECDAETLRRRAEIFS
jgi:predicted acetyltransferase